MAVGSASWSKFHQLEDFDMDFKGQFTQLLSCIASPYILPTGVRAGFLNTIVKRSFFLC